MKKMRMSELSRSLAKSVNVQEVEGFEILQDEQDLFDEMES